MMNQGLNGNLPFMLTNQTNLEIELESYWITRVQVGEKRKKISTMFILHANMWIRLAVLWQLVRHLQAPMATLFYDVGFVSMSFSSWFNVYRYQRHDGALMTCPSPLSLSILFFQVVIFSISFLPSLINSLISFAKIIVRSFFRIVEPLTEPVDQAITIWYAFSLVAWPNSSCLVCFVF
jgi:hypothetical protein